MFLPADATPAQKAAASISEDIRVSQPRSHPGSLNSIADARPSMTATSAVSWVFASPRMPSVPNVSIPDPLLPKTLGEIGYHQADHVNGTVHGPVHLAGSRR